jgi:predicted amidophosphoribosyltransferase
MYCPSCGAKSTLELNYCSRCGANVAVSTAPQREFVPISLTKPAVVIGLTVSLLTLGGFAVLITSA